MRKHKIYFKVCNGTRRVDEGYVETISQLECYMRGVHGIVLRRVCPGFYRTQNSNIAVYYERIY